VCERIGGQQVAEFVVHLRLRHVQPRQEGHASKNRERSDGRHSQPPVSRKFRKVSLDPLKQRLAQSWLGPDKYQAYANNNPIQFVQGVRPSQKAKVLSLNDPSESFQTTSGRRLVTIKLWQT
jgi:hypothetical protein